MDVFTAKTLVSALLVFGIALFSVISFHHFVTEMVADLRAARKQSVPARRSVEELSRRT